MSPLSRICLICLWLVQNVQASDNFNHISAVGMACGVAARSVFDKCEHQDYACFCNSNLYVYIVEDCIGQHTRYNMTHMGEAFDKFERGFCLKHGIHANVTDVWSPKNMQLNPHVSEKVFDWAYESEKNIAFHKTRAVWLGLGLIFYWALIVSVVFLYHIFQKVVIRLFTLRMVMRPATRIERFFQKHVFWPALFNSRHMYRYEYFQGFVAFSLPTRFECIIVSIYIILNVIFMVTPYRFMDNDQLLQTRWREMMRYSSDRAGIIATIQFPLVFLFAMRNNIFIWMTGWSYSTFNTYHRAVARVTYLQLIVHAVIKHIFSASYGGSLVKYYYPLPYFRWGVAAMGLFALMILSATLRSRGYEMFYRLHQALTIGGLVCSVYHLNGLGFKQPLWISIAFWGGDWAIRFGRILLFNINLVLPPIPGAQSFSFGTARLYSNQTIRITITTPVRWLCRPGQYVFLHTNRWNFIGGHPFSVLGSSENGNGLELVLKTRAGMTHRLFSNLDGCSCSSDYPVTLPVYVEGPYGHSAPVEYYDEGLFFAGGIGITGVVEYMEKMLGSSKTSSLPRTIRLFWTVRNRSDIDPIAHRLAELMGKEGIYIRIFQRQQTLAVTDPIAAVPLNSSDSPDDSASLDLEQENETLTPQKVKFEQNVSDGITAISDPHDREIGSTKNIATTAARASLNGQRFRHSAEYSVSGHSRHSTSSSKVTAVESGSSPKRKSFRFSSMGFNSQHPEQNRRYTRILSFLGPRSSNGARSSARKSIIDFVKSGNPEEEEENEYDYGKDEFIANYTKHRSVDGDDEGKPDISVPKRKSMLPPSTKVAHPIRRDRMSKFVEAGFTDSVTDRRMTVLNPFDNETYPLDEAFENYFITPKAPTMIEPVYDLIEPIGMDVAQLINFHFKQSEGSVCVVGCGPDRMMDTLCWSCCEFADSANNGRVDYYEESFRW